MTQIIVDTSGLYALVDRKDPHHQQAAVFLKSYAIPRGLLISNHIFDETMTTVKGRLGAQVALQLGIRLRNSRLVEMVIFTQADEQELWRLFSRYTDKAWSYTDCACWMLAQRRDIQQAFSFDHHFKQMGLTTVP